MTIRITFGIICACFLIGCASGGKLAGAVPINIEAPDTATADHGSAAGNGWLNVQSIGGGAGLVVCFAIFAWAITKAYNRFLCRYPATCTPQR